MPSHNQHDLSPLFNPSTVILVGNASLQFLSAWKKDHTQSCTFICADQDRVDPMPDSLNGVAAGERADLAIVQVAQHLTASALAVLSDRPPKTLIMLSPLPSDEDTRICRHWGETHDCQILGPHSFGLQRPHIGLNASLHPQLAKAGRVAVVLQSRSLTASVMDWADDNSSAFSAIVSLGTEAMLDIPKVLDFLAVDPRTDSIALYLEDINDSRSFLSALRAASSVKPVVVLKAGRYNLKRSSVQPLGKAETDTSNHQSCISPDQVFDSAIRRAGAVRVRQFVQLFSAVKALSIPKRTTGRRLAILANGSGPAQLAFDLLFDGSKVECAEIKEKTASALESLFGATSWTDNPVVSFESLTAESMKQGLTLLLNDSGVDGVLVLITPDPTSRDMPKIAEVIAETIKTAKKPIITNFLGDAMMRPLRQVLDQAGCPSFRTPEAAMDAFASLATYHYNQTLLLQIPSDGLEVTSPDIEGAKLILENAVSEQRSTLSEPEAKAILAAFNIDIIPSVLTRSPTEAVITAEQIGFPVALKIASPDIPKKSDVKGIHLDIRNANELVMAYHQMILNCQKSAPKAEISGIIVQAMASDPSTLKLTVGIARDPLFGPVVYCTEGEASGNPASGVELAPLNRFLARQLIERTPLWHHYLRAKVSNNVLTQLENTLIRLSELAAALPEVALVEINPLLIHNGKVSALDTRITLCQTDELNLDFHKNYEHMAIHPYPVRLVQHFHFKDGLPYTIRPIRPEDASALQDFTRGLSSESRYMRFISAMRELSPSMLKRYTQIDYSRELALVATVLTPHPMRPYEFHEEVIGVARYLLNPDGHTAEYALVIGDQWQKRGLGSQLMKTIIQGAKEQNLKRIEGFVLKSNSGMQTLMRSLGFVNQADPEDDDMRYIYLDF